MAIVHRLSFRGRKGLAERVPGFRPDAGGAPRGGVRPLLRMARHGWRARRDLGLHAAFLISAGRGGDASRQFHRARVPARRCARRRRGDRDALAVGHRRTLAGHARTMLGRRLRLAADAGVQDRRGLALRRLPDHADGGGRIQHRHQLRPPDHREAGARSQGEPHSARSGQWHLDRLQHLGRLQSLPGHHGPECRPVRHHGLDRASVGEGLYQAAR